ncbi:MAG TPA: hypothetical protein VK131_08920 [Candidatus Acidoferrales bacterium]|nr:hypothetical protein [Candidatus Acidoferrales bacterium]
MGKLRVAFDDQVRTGVCKHCGGGYRSVWGTVFEEQEAVAMYCADLYDHFHEHSEPRVVLALAVGDWRDQAGSRSRCAVSMQAWGVGNEVHFAVTDARGSPWQEWGMVGWSMTRREALSSPLLDTFFRIADHIAYYDHRLDRTLGLKGSRTGPHL